MAPRPSRLEEGGGLELFRGGFSSAYLNVIVEYTAGYLLTLIYFTMVLKFLCKYLCL